MRRRKHLDDRLNPCGQLPDRDIDAGQEADDGTDNRACDRKRVVALEKRNEEQHQRGIAKCREQNQPEYLEELHAREHCAALAEQIQLAEHERDHAHDDPDDERAQDISARDADARHGRGADVLDDLLGLILHHGAKSAHRGGHRRDRDESRDDPAVHEVARAGHALHAAGPYVAEEERIHADDDKHRQQREKHGSPVFKEDEEIALHKIDHANASLSSK